MNYPLISEYVEAIKLAEDNLDQLSYLRPVLDNEGRPVMSSGNFAVVFKMKDIRNGNLYALKCFTRFQDGRDQAYRLISDELSNVMSPYLVSIKYIDGELFVSSKNTADMEFPVAVMDWVEGVTLDKFIRQHLHEQSLLRKLSEKFNRMSLWLKSQPFAHGDLKPDNILTLEDGSLVLVDYDGMFVPTMKGQKARELGSPDYRHPSRTINDFNEHIDDFSLDSIAMQLYAISLQPEMLTTSDGETLLLTEKDYLNLGKSSAMKKILSLNRDTEFNKLIDAFLLAFPKDEILDQFKHISNICKPVIIQTNVSTEATADDWANQIKDEFGARYSSDGKRLIEIPNISIYRIKPGTQIICNSACYNPFVRDLDISHLTEISIPKSVTHIGDSAFLDCENLTNVSIPNSVIHIGNEAFSGCSNLTHITIPESLNHFGDGVFIGCSSLTSVNIPSSATHIGNNVFSGCKELTKIIIPDSVTHIGNGAFSGCKGLSNIIIPNSVTHIGDDAFSCCSGLSEITIPSSVTHIGNGAFSGCSGLTNVNIPNSITKIGDGFLGMSGLTSIIIPNSVTHIGNNAFYRCEGLTEINIPNSITHIGEGAFIGCKGLTSVNIPNLVTHIGDNTFSGCQGLTSINIPNSITHIGDSAFSGCEGLTSVNIPDSVSYIGNKAFSGCSGLRSIIIPEMVTHIGIKAFSNCKLKDIRVSVSNQEYDSREDCNAIIHTASNALIAGCSKTIIPNSVTNIEDGAFKSCRDLTFINIPDSVTHIGDGAFYGCEGLININILNTVTHIGDKAFYGCKGLTNINIPNTVTHIGDGAFYGCEGLTNINIPYTVTHIGDKAFSGCKRLTSVNISSSITQISNSAFHGCKKLTSIIIPDTVTHIGGWAFYECGGLTSVNFPNSITHIEDFAFCECSGLTCITFSDSVIHIGGLAFYECNNLSKIYIPLGSFNKFKTLLPGFEHLFVELEERPF